MKKLFFNLAVVATVFFTMFVGTTELNAQNKTSQRISTRSDMFLGGGLGYATEIQNVGFWVKGAYRIANQFEVAPQFNYYLEKDYVTYYDIFVNGNFIFYSANAVDLYASAGLAVTTANVSIGGINASESETGFNLGVGVYYKLSSGLFLDAGFKYVFGDADHLLTGIGLMYNF